MTPHFVINIGREFGCGAKRIGEALAKRLGVPIYDKELINLAARESGYSPELFERADEKERKGVLSSLIGYFRVPISGSYYTSDPLSNETLFQIQSDVIRRLANEGSCIFIGRCADYILREHPNTINLFFTADREDRLARIIERNGCTQEEAEAAIERIDAERARYYNYYTGGNWGHAAQYDLTLNTTRLGDEATLELVIEYLAKRLKNDPTK